MRFGRFAARPNVRSKSPNVINFGLSEVFSHGCQNAASALAYRRVCLVYMEVAKGPSMATLHHLRDEPSAAEVRLNQPSPDEIRQHLDVILAGDEFCSSRRSSELLQHIVERALAGDVESLKERLLGVEIFHRRSDYDTSSDSIVRVTANDVRRRLSNFYAEHPAQSMRISLPLGSYVPDFMTLVAREHSLETPHLEDHLGASGGMSSPVHFAEEQVVPPSFEARRPKSLRMTRPLAMVLLAGVVFALGWWLRGVVHGPVIPQADRAYAFYNDLLGPIGAKGNEDTEIALTNPHVLLYLGLKSAGPPLGNSSIDVPVPDDMASVLDQTANDNQADFPYHHFFVDTTNYTGLGEATAAFGLARLLQATGRSARLTSARFLNWEAARQEPLVILGAPHESAFVQSTLSAANFTIGYDSIHDAHPLPGEQTDYSKSRHGDVLEDYGLIWMTKSPSGTRVLVLAGLSSAGTAGVGEFFTDPERMRPVYEQLLAKSKAGTFPESWQVLLRIQAREDVPINVSPVAMRITGGN